jgi:hypothetical protein
MTDITERLRDLARDNGYRGIGEYWNACEEAADEIYRLRARVAELEAERDAAFEMSRCECDSDEACRNLAALHRRVAELEAARGEPVVFVRVAGGMLGGATRGPGMASLADGDHAIYTAPPAPAVDVDAISDERIQSGSEAYFAECSRLEVTGEQSADIYMRCMRAALRAIFNKVE